MIGQIRVSVQQLIKILLFIILINNITTPFPGSQPRWHGWVLKLAEWFEKRYPDS